MITVCVCALRLDYITFHHFTPGRSHGTVSFVRVQVSTVSLAVPVTPLLPLPFFHFLFAPFSVAFLPIPLFLFHRFGLLTSDVALYYNTRTTLTAQANLNTSATYITPSQLAAPCQDVFDYDSSHRSTAFFDSSTRNCLSHLITTLCRTPKY